MQPHRFGHEPNHKQLLDCLTDTRPNVPVCKSMWGQGRSCRSPPLPPCPDFTKVHKETFSRLSMMQRQWKLRPSDLRKMPRRLLWLCLGPGRCFLVVPFLVTGLSRASPLLGLGLGLTLVGAFPSCLGSCVCELGDPCFIREFL